MPADRSGALAWFPDTASRRGAYETVPTDPEHLEASTGTFEQPGHRWSHNFVSASVSTSQPVISPAPLHRRSIACSPIALIHPVQGCEQVLPLRDEGTDPFAAWSEFLCATTSRWSSTTPDRPWRTRGAY